MSSTEQRGEAGGRRIALFVALGAALVALAFYREFAFDRATMLFGSDMVGEGFPLRQFALDEVRAGRGVPGWTPYVYGGMPYVGLLPGPLFYPTSLLYLLMPLHRAIGWTFVAHTFLAALFGYFLGRSFRLRPASAAIVACSFMLTGYVTSHLFGGQDGRLFAMTLFPLALGSLERACRSGAPRWWAALGAVIALQVLTPHVQVMYFSVLALGAFLLFHLAFRAGRGAGDAPGGRQRAIVGALLGFAGAGLLAIGLSAVQLFPAFALLEHVVRAAPETGYEFAASWAMPPQELTGLFLPDLIGSVESYWGSNVFKLHTEYLGAVPIALALMAVAAALGGPLRERRPLVLFLAGATLLGLLFALGSATPVHRIGYLLLPLMKSFRAPAMMLGVVAALVALLAGFGWEAVLRARQRDIPAAPWLLVGVLSAPFIALGLAAALAPGGLQSFVGNAWYPAGWRLPPEGGPEALRRGGLWLLAGWGLALGLVHATSRRRVGEIAVVALILFTVVDLWRVDQRYLRVLPADQVLASDPVIDALETAPEPGERVWAFPGTYRRNEFMYWSIPAVDGSQKFLLSHYASLIGGFDTDRAFLQNAAVLWPLFDLRYFVAPEVEADGVALRTVGPRGNLYEFLPPVPHAYFPARIQMQADSAAALRQVLATPDPTAISVVNPGGGGDRLEAGEGRAEVRSHLPDEVVLAVEADRSGVLVVSEIFHPYWTAYLDGTRVPIHRANVAFRAVVVPAGSHELVFRYESPAYSTGIWVSLASLAGFLALLLIPADRLRGFRSLAGRRAAPAD